MKRFLIAVALGAAFVGYQHYTYTPGDLAVLDDKAPYKLIMYSLTTCGYCKEKAQLLHREQIAFTEYFIDADDHRFEEVTRKLAAAGFEPRGYGTPIFDAHGTMLPNNPSMEVLRATLRRNMPQSSLPRQAAR